MQVEIGDLLKAIVRECIREERDRPFILSELPESVRIAEIKRSYRHEGKVRTDLLYAEESLYGVTVRCPLPDGFEKVAVLVDNLDGMGMFLIRPCTPAAENQ